VLFIVGGLLALAIAGCLRTPHGAAACAWSGTVPMRRVAMGLSPDRIRLLATGAGGALAGSRLLTCRSISPAKLDGRDFPSGQGADGHCGL